MTNIKITINFAENRNHLALKIESKVKSKNINYFAIDIKLCVGLMEKIKGSFNLY